VAHQPFETAPDERDLTGEDEFAWSVLLAASEASERLELGGEVAAFGITHEGQLQPLRRGEAAEAVITWRPGLGWESHWPDADPRTPMMDLYLPICSGTSARPVTVGHLGQSLDGFIATHAGESRWVTGQENLLHMHRLRALTDAVIVGAATVAMDDPQLTTRLVPGPNPLRVVLDPSRRLGDQFRIFNDPSAETLYVCAQSALAAGPARLGLATIVGVDGSSDGLDVQAVMQLLHARGCARVFVEGGGVTVSMFLEANLLDRLHMAIAPLLIGDGRPAIRLRPQAALGDCTRPRYRVFRMGGDVMFDCELGGDAGPSPDANLPIRSVTRVI
jgi:diaminohydroxyphosphoribosylaminopyrimidine deaminase/5-amino-6-(5-phosphoribosylamino)uracil reductase